MIRKIVVSNGSSEREVVLAGHLVIGRDPSCHVCEPDPLLSRRHAEIVATSRGVSIRDLSSRNGILVNGEKTREQVLLPGDVVQLGHLQLRYLEEEKRTVLPSDTPIPRGRAGFEKVVGRRPEVNADPDATQLHVRVDPDRTMAMPSAGALDGSNAGNDTVVSDDTLREHISRLAGLAGARSQTSAPGARLTADAELTIVDATPECADLLGIPGEPLVGDSLTDVFMRGVRRAYADPGSAISFTVARGEHGAIAVTLSLNTNGHE